MDKILIINKDKGYTSRDIVNIVSKKFNTKKVGHFGTLDPLATGVLVIGIGKLTKIGDLFTNQTKEYIADVLVGTSTDTYDVTGNILNKIEINTIDKELLEKVVLGMKKKYLQEVPIYSAVKVHGKKLYEYARENIEVDLPKKEIEIFDINLLDIYELNNNLYFKIYIHSSKGTYIRSLINDISKEMNIPLCMSNLQRIKQGNFDIKDAYTLEDLEKDNYKLFDIEEVLDVEIINIKNDIRIKNGSLIEKNNYKDLVLFRENNKNIALYKTYEKDKSKMKPKIIF